MAARSLATACVWSVTVCRDALKTKSTSTQSSSEIAIERCQLGEETSLSVCGVLQNVRNRRQLHGRRS